MSSRLRRIGLQTTKAFVALLLSTVAPLASAEWITCTTSDEFRFKTISWNSVSRKAKGTDRLGDAFAGRITAIRKDSDGNRINIEAVYEHRVMGPMQIEIVMYPVYKAHRVMAVGYVTHEGQRLLNMNFGNHLADCVG